MKTKAIITSVAIFALAGCGQKEVVREVLVTSPPATEAPAPEPNKFDQYLVSMYDTAAQSREWEDGELLEFGSVVCDSFDAGLTLVNVLEIFASYSTGSYDDEFFVAVIGNAVLYLCPQHLAYVQGQLN